MKTTTKPTTARMTDLDEIRQFIRSPKAEFTLESKVSGGHCTYKRWDGMVGSNPYPYMFLSFLSAPDEYSHLGMLTFTTSGNIDLKVTTKSPRNGKCFKALDWFLRHLAKEDNKLDQVEFHHAGKCCRCGRTLTTPDSIRSGIGPVCATRI